MRHVTAGRTFRLSSLVWLPLVVPLLLVVAFSVAALATGEIPEMAYLLTDPVAFPGLTLSMAGAVLLPGLFGRAPSRPPPGAPPRPARWGLRVLGAGAILISCTALHFVILRGAAPTRQAVDLMRRHAVAGKKIGTPVEIGWGARGYIHAEGSVNDEHVLPHIDASVPVSGPRGSGRLSIEGRVEGARWVFTRVILRLDEGGERVDIVGAPAPRGSGESYEVDPVLMVVIGISVLLAGLVALGFAWVLRSTDPGRAVASIEAPAGAPITLRFTAREARAHRVWLRFEVEYEGGEDDYGVTAELRAQVTGGITHAVEHRIGDRAPALGPSGRRNTSLYRAGSMSGPEGDSVRATAEVMTLPALPAGAEVVITGRVVVAEGQRATGLLLFVLPA